MTIQRYDPFDGGLGFSLATRVGSLVYTAGMIGFDGTTAAVPDDPNPRSRISEMPTKFKGTSTATAASAVPLWDRSSIAKPRSAF